MYGKCTALALKPGLQYDAGDDSERGRCQNVDDDTVPFTIPFDERQ